MRGSGSAWRLPGYDVLDLLGFGASGEVWRARERASGELVALKRLRPDAAPAVVAAVTAAVQREAAVLRALGTRHVVRLRAVVDGVLVLDHADGGSLAALLLARGRLEPGEVVTLAVPLAEALAAAHARGLVHGDVRPGNVLLTAGGVPLLSDLGLARLLRGAGVPVGGAASPAEDVRALGAVVHHALVGSPPGAAGALPDGPLGRAVAAALAQDPAARPDAATLARALRAACAPSPLRLPPRAAGGAATGAVAGLAPVQAPDPVPSAGARVPLAVALTALLLLVAAAGAGWRLGASERPVAAAAVPSELPSAPPAWPASRWAAVLDDLDARRSAAWAAGDPAALAGTYAPGSPALRADRAALGRLVADGRRVRGLRHDVQAVAPLAVTATTARLRVRDALAAHEVLAPDGTVLERRPPRGAADLVVELVLTADGWRLRALRPG